MFLVSDGPGLRELLGIDPWDETPLVNFDAHPGSLRTEGDARAAAYRKRLVREIARRGQLRFEDVNAADDEVAGRAWDRLGVVAVRVGVPPETWDRIRENAGWEKVPPQKGE